MFDPAPVRPIIAVRVRETMERDIRREAKKRKLRISEEVRRRLEFYAAHRKTLDAPAAPRQPEDA